MNEVGRQSAIGTKNRVMQDKAYQKEVERELVEVKQGVWLGEWWCQMRGGGDVGLVGRV